METQAALDSVEVSPKEIVQQLLEIAKKYDALDEIGGATSWRWQEGIISRMPKSKTVIKVLKKAYKSDDPYAWYLKTTGPLQVFIKNSLLNGSRIFDVSEPRDIYEALFIILVKNGRGVTFSELVIQIASIRFLKCNATEDKHSYYFSEDIALEVYGNWATDKARGLIELYCPKKNDDLYYFDGGSRFTSEAFFEFQQEIQCLRFKVVGHTSEVDMWRSEYIALSDDEMVHIERMYVDLQKKIDEEIKKITECSFRCTKKLHPRILGFVTNTLPVSRKVDVI